MVSIIPYIEWKWKSMTNILWVLGLVCFFQETLIITQKNTFVFICGIFFSFFQIRKVESPKTVREFMVKKHGTAPILKKIIEHDQKDNRA